MDRRSSQPGGYPGDSSGCCHCIADRIARYRGRTSGPLMDRIDMNVEVQRLAPGELSGSPDPDDKTSDQIRKHMERAQAFQLESAGKPNHAFASREVDKYRVLNAAGRRLVEQAMARLGLLARAFHQVLKVARTIADLASEKQLRVAHLSEAIGYRRFDRHEARF